MFSLARTSETIDGFFGAGAEAENAAHQRLVILILLLVDPELLVELVVDQTCNVGSRDLRLWRVDPARRLYLRTRHHRRDLVQRLVALHVLLLQVLVTRRLLGIEGRLRLRQLLRQPGVLEGGLRGILLELLPLRGVGEAAGAKCLLEGLRLRLIGESALRVGNVHQGFCLTSGARNRAQPCLVLLLPERQHGVVVGLGSVPDPLIGELLLQLLLLNIQLRIELAHQRLLHLLGIIGQTTGAGAVAGLDVAGVGEATQIQSGLHAAAGVERGSGARHLTDRAGIARRRCAGARIEGGTQNAGIGGLLLAHVGQIELGLQVGVRDRLSCRVSVCVAVNCGMV